MSTSKLGFKYLGKLIILYLPMLLLILVFSMIDSASYTKVPSFIQYIISTLDNGNGLEKVNLPSWLTDFFLSGNDTVRIVVYTALALAAFQFIRCIFKFFMSIYRSFFGQKITYKIRKDLYEHIQTLSYTYHNGADTGDLIQRCTSDIDLVQTFIISYMPEVVSVFAVLISAVVQMSKVNTKLTLVSLIIVPVAFISSLIFCVYIEKRYELIEKKEAGIMTIMQENLANVRVVKAFANEKYELERFAKASQEYSNLNLKLNKTSSIFWGFSDFTTMAQYMLTILVAINLVKNNPGSIALSDVTLFLSLVGSYIWPVRSLGRMIGEAGKCAVSAGRINEILTLPSEYETNGTEKPAITGEIVFDNVWFKFDDTDKYLLKGVDFSVKAGETLAIVGKTGCGKSTIAKILTRLNEYNSGHVYLDGVCLKDIEKHHLRENVGLILQDPFLYSKSVYGNIAITDKKIDKDRVYEVSRMAAIEKDIKGFDNGYDTIVGEKGATLSGGQKQRVAIARMLLKEKPIIIFDDSLSALDTETDLMIRKALKAEASTHTTIIITHRITTAKQADKIIVIEDGVIADCGTHDELSVKEGLYKKLWDIQGDLEKEFMKVLNAGGEK